jgi:hypothetical protein
MLFAPGTPPEVMAAAERDWLRGGGSMDVDGQTVLNPRLQQPMDGRPSVPVSQEYLDAITQPQRPIPSQQPSMQQPSMQQPSMQQPSMQQPQINSMMGGGLGALISQLMGGYGGFNPYMGGYGGFNPYMGGYGGFNPYMGGYGGFNPMMGGYGGFNPMMGGYGGFNPMMGGYGGFSPMMGGIGGFLSQPQFGGGFLNQMMGTQQTGLGGSPNNQTMSQPRSPNLSMFGGASVSPMRNFSGGADLGNRPAPQPLNSPAQPAQQQGTGGGGLF